MIFKTLFKQTSNGTKEKSLWKVLRAKAKSAEGLGNYQEALTLYKNCLEELDKAFSSGQSSLSERYYNFKSSELRFAAAKVQRILEDRTSQN
jgi:hypothetical protein